MTSRQPVQDGFKDLAKHKKIQTSKRMACLADKHKSSSRKTESQQIALWQLLCHILHLGPYPSITAKVQQNRKKTHPLEMRTCLADKHKSSSRNAKSQQIAVWQLLYQVPRPGRYISRLQTIRDLRLETWDMDNPSVNIDWLMRLVDDLQLSATGLVLL